MMLNLSIEELETLRRLQHNKEFEPYWARLPACRCWPMVTMRKQSPTTWE